MFDGALLDDRERRTVGHHAINHVGYIQAEVMLADDFDPDELDITSLERARRPDHA